MLENKKKERKKSLVAWSFFKEQEQKINFVWPYVDPTGSPKIRLKPIEKWLEEADAVPISSSYLYIPWLVPNNCGFVNELLVP